MALSATLTLEFSPTTGPFETPLWEDITSYWLRAAQIARGKAHEFAQFSPGRLVTTLDNSDRRFDPTYAAGPYFGNLKPRRPIRLTAVYNAATYRVFTGFIDGFPQDYEGPNLGVVEISANDGLGILGRTDLPSVWEQNVLPVDPDIWLRVGEDRGTACLDSSGNARHGTYVGGATFNTRVGLVTGDSDNAIEFDGIDDYIALPAADDLSLGSGAIGFLIKRPTMTSAADLTLIERGATGGGQQFRAQILGTSAGTDRGKLRFWAGGAAWTMSSVAVDDDSNHFVFWRYGPSATIHVDGTDRTGTTGSAAWTAAQPTTVIGAASDGTALFAGTLDEVLLWGNGAMPSVAEGQTLAAAALEPWDEDTPNARITRVLDYVGWPAGSRDLDTGSAQLGSAHLETKAAEHLDAVAAAEGARSMLYVAGDGDLTFVGRQNFWTEAVYTDSNGTFGDDPASINAGSELPYFHEGVRLEHDETEVINRARVAPITGHFQQTDSVASQTDHGIQSFEERIIEKRAAYALNAAEYYVNEHDEAATRLEEITIKPEMKPAALYPVVLGADFGYRYTVKRRPQLVGSAIELTVHLDHVEHTITPDSWTAKWGLSPAEPARFIWGGDGATEGWGTGVWAY